MNTTTVRLTVLDQTVDRLVSVRGPRVSDLLRRARAKTSAGELPPPPTLHTVASSRLAARGSGVLAGEGSVAVAQGSVPEGLSPRTPVRQDARGGAEGHSDATDTPTRSTGAGPGLAGESEIAASTVTEETLLARIDATLARANGHV